MYNNWKLLEIGGQKGYWAVVGLVPFVSIISLIFELVSIHNINKKLGYDATMTMLAILLAPVWLIIIGLGKNTWNESLGDPRLDTPDFTPAGPAPQSPAQV